jgi:hypothetical protein
MSSVTPTTRTYLAFRSGDRCAFVGCDVYLTADGCIKGEHAIIGEAAHIAGEKPGSARYDRTMTDADRNHYKNLIYLCATHHTRIDKQPQEFPVDRLHEIKRTHEKKVRDAITQAFAEVGFAELATACEWVSLLPPENLGSDYSVVTPTEKIAKNGISSEAGILVKTGLSIARLVKSYIEQETDIDPEFPERLKAGFLKKYYAFVHMGLKGTELFYSMCEFAQAGLRDIVKRTAGLAVLMYLFEACEVFEK